MTDVVRIVSRKSPLALWQTHHVAQLLRDRHGVQTEVLTMDTLGDKIRDQPLPKIGAKGLFTAELEEALHHGEADLAVHSLKDLPSTLPDGLAYAGSPMRADATDCLVARGVTSFEALPEGAVVATGSVRRRAQLLARRPDLRFEELRGNIDTRLRKLEENGWDAIVMATAALRRLERPELISTELAPPQFIPAVSQGAIGIEIRADRHDVAALVRAISDDDTVAACTAERRFMAQLEGGCSVPVAAYCTRTAEGWELWGWVGSTDGRQVLHESRRGPNPTALADALADDFLARGALEIIGR